MKYIQKYESIDFDDFDWDYEEEEKPLSFDKIKLGMKIKMKFPLIKFPSKANDDIKGKIISKTVNSIIIKTNQGYDVVIKNSEMEKFEIEIYEIY